MSHDDHSGTPPDLDHLTQALRASRAMPTALELDAIKRRAMGQAAAEGSASRLKGRLRWIGPGLLGVQSHMLDTAARLRNRGFTNHFNDFAGRQGHFGP